MYGFIGAFILAACIAAVLGWWVIAAALLIVAILLIFALSYDSWIDRLKVFFSESERGRKKYCKDNGLPYIKMDYDSH